MIYLAAPYSHPSASLRANRVRATAYIVAYLAHRGEVAFSPILHGHYTEVSTGKEIPWQIWMSHGFGMLEKATKMMVLELPGWKESKGVTAELKKAEELNIPLEMLGTSFWYELVPYRIIKLIEDYKIRE